MARSGPQLPHSTQNRGVGWVWAASYLHFPEASPKHVQQRHDGVWGAGRAQQSFAGHGPLPLWGPGYRGPEAFWEPALAPCSISGLSSEREEAESRGQSSARLHSRRLQGKEGGREGGREASWGGGTRRRVTDSNSEPLTSWLGLDSDASWNSLNITVPKLGVSSPLWLSHWAHYLLAASCWMIHRPSLGASGQNPDSSVALEKFQGEKPREESPQPRKVPGRWGDSHRRGKAYGLRKPSLTGSSGPWVMGSFSHPALTSGTVTHSAILGKPPSSGPHFSQLYNERQAHRLLSLKCVVWLLFGIT